MASLCINMGLLMSSHRKQPANVLVRNLQLDLKNIYPRGKKPYIIISSMDYVEHGKLTIYIRVKKRPGATYSYNRILYKLLHSYALYMSESREYGDDIRENLGRLLRYSKAKGYKFKDYQGYVKPHVLYKNTNKKYQECPICTELFSANDKLYNISCHHNFHTSCLNDWMDHGGTGCPMCRKPLNIV